MRTLWYCLTWLTGIQFAFVCLGFVLFLVASLVRQSLDTEALIYCIGYVFGASVPFLLFRYLYEQREKAHWAKVEQAERQAMTQTDA